MEIVEFCERLILFYSEVQKMPFVRVILDEDLRQVTLRFRDQVSITTADIGFYPGLSCYITRNLAITNIKLIEQYLSDEFDKYLRTIVIKGNKCFLIAYDIYGHKVIRIKMKLTSINLF